MKNLLIFCFLTFTFSASAQGESLSANTEQTVAELTKAKVKVKGATCKTDLGIIVSNVEKIAGVAKCEILKHGAVTTLEVSYDSAKTDMAKVQETILNTGTCEDANARLYTVKI